MTGKPLTIRQRRMEIQLQKYKTEVQQELQKILSYWVSYAVDNINGGFIGQVDNDNHVNEKAPKGSVLNSRILWTFSAAYNVSKNVQYLQMAERAYKYINRYFVDKDYGGVYWTVDYRGKPLDTKKQVYALAFAVYGLSEYFKSTEEEDAKQLAIKMYEGIVQHSYDKQYGGYIEALTREWKQTEELRLSAKDANEKKSMNTHLHVLEGFANLYSVWPDAELKQRIQELINIFLDHIIDPDTGHLLLFFDEQWQRRGNIHSYGHDIEAAWLILEAAEGIADEMLIKKVKEVSLRIADAATQGLDTDGGLWYEYDVDENKLIKEKHSWPQAEAMVGYFNAWQLSGKNSYLQASFKSWEFIKKYIIHPDKGEWYWGITENNNAMDGQDKVGLWKCPYHNTRACMEIIKRINKTKG